MKVILLVQQGRKPSRALTLKGPEAIIGRSHGNAVRIPSNDISRRHCRLLIGATKVTIEDLDSLNGTYLNSRRVDEVCEVHAGDHILLGPVTFIVGFTTEEDETDEPDNQELVEAEDIDPTLVDPALHRAEARTSPGKSAGKRPQAPRKPERKQPAHEDEPDLVPLLEEERPEEEEDEAPIPLAGARPASSKKPAKPAQPAAKKKSQPASKEADKMIPLAGERPPREEPEVEYVDFDQAWKVPEPNDMRSILQGLEEGEAIKDEKENEDEEERKK
jgi:pSer/pThr/pTyr-binding forkhead associated (FHA) protein